MDRRTFIQQKTAAGVFFATMPFLPAKAHAPLNAQGDELPFRHIHLDFHTSRFIEGIGAGFDPERFADTLAKAHVNSINCYALPKL